MVESRKILIFKLNWCVESEGTGESKDLNILVDLVLSNLKALGSLKI